MSFKKKSTDKAKESAKAAAPSTGVGIAEDFEKLVREMQGLEDIAIGATKDLFNIG